jgi:signal peptidase I
MKKWLSRTFTGILGAFIVFLLGCQVAMVVSSNKNYGVPSLFGYSFMRVATDSMEGSADDSLPTGTGIVISKVSVSSIEPGDVITFYSTSLQGPVTHRVREIASDSDGLVFYTMGDNAHAETCPSKDTPDGCTYPNNRDTVLEKYYIGKVVGHSDAFGGFLNVVLSTWFVPVAVLLPLAVIIGISGYDIYKEGKAEEKQEDAEVAAELAKAGVDPKDEKAVLLYEEKARYKIEVRKELEKTKNEEKERIRKEMAKGGKGKA